MKKTLCTTGKSQQKCTKHRKTAPHQKRGQWLEKQKPTVKVKRYELGIYETERSVLDKIQRININQRSFSKNIQGTYDALYKVKTWAKQDLLCICKPAKLMSTKARGEQASAEIEAA
jgi:hypothetical protein